MFILQWGNVGCWNLNLQGRETLDVGDTGRYGTLPISTDSSKVRSSLLSQALDSAGLACEIAQVLLESS